MKEGNPSGPIPASHSLHIGPHRLDTDINLGQPTDAAVVRINKTSVVPRPPPTVQDDDDVNGDASEHSGGEFDLDDGVHLVSADADADADVTSTQRVAPHAATGTTAIANPRIFVNVIPHDGASNSLGASEHQPPAPGQRWITADTVPAELAECVEARRADLTTTLRQAFGVTGFRELQLEAVVSMVEVKVSSFLSLSLSLSPPPTFTAALRSYLAWTAVAVTLNAVRSPPPCRSPS